MKDESPSTSKNISADEIAHWEPWQKDYRYGLVLIIPPEPILTSLNDLRARHDPASARISDSHISLSNPLLHPLSEAEHNQILRISSSIHPFLIKLGPLEHFLPKPCIYLAVNSTFSIAELRGELQKSGYFAQSSAYEYKPHLTISEFGTKDEPGTQQLINSLSTNSEWGEFICNGLWLIQPDSEFIFRKTRFFPFGTP